MLQSALDTGATATLINRTSLLTIGYDPVLSQDRAQVTTGSAVESVPRLELSRIVALGQERAGLQVLAHTFPPTAGIDGLFGLDFLLGQRLVLDFRAGMLQLN